MLMREKNTEMNEYLLLVKKITGYTVKAPEHNYLKEDIVQEVFIKLLRGDFFTQHDFYSEKDKGKIIAYIKKVVRTCYIDQLKAQGINRRLTQSEQSESGNKYKNIENTPFESIDQDDLSLQHSDTPEQYMIFKEAYHWIKNCFDMLVTEISDHKRMEFLEAAFWRSDQYGLPIKKLAHHLSYNSTNPTQELNRFVEKVSSCTQGYGITINNLHGQLQIIQEELEKQEGYS